MKFYELLKKYSNEEILKALHKNYNDISDDAYLSALDELRTLRPSTEKQNIKINVEFTKDDGKEYLECDGIGPDENGGIIRWGLEFDQWENWLAKEIDEESFNKLDDLTILAGIMWELTYNGFSQNVLEGKRTELENKCKKKNIFYTIMSEDRFLPSNLITEWTNDIIEAIKFINKKDADKYLKTLRKNLGFKIIKVDCNLSEVI